MSRLAPLCTLAVLALGTASAVAGTVIGKLELPAPPPRPPVAVRGFLERVENARRPIQPVAVAPHLLVVLETEAPLPDTPTQVTWQLVGESFSPPVLGVRVDAEVVIRNVSRTARTLVALQDPNLVPPGPINPTGPKTFKPAKTGVYTISDKDAPHLRGTLVVVGSPWIAHVEGTRFELAKVPEGTYKLRVFYKDHWIAMPAQTVTVGKGKTEVTVKIPAGYPPSK